MCKNGAELSQPLIECSLSLQQRRVYPLFLLLLGFQTRRTNPAAVCLDIPGFQDVDTYRPFSDERRRQLRECRES